MSQVPEELLYSKNHIWIEMKDDFDGICGITDYAQGFLRDIVFIEVIDEGMEVNRDEKILYIESITDIFDIVSPLTGKILKINNELEKSTGIINEDPYGEGWIFELDIRSRIEMEELMDHEQYIEFIEDL